MGPPLPPPLNRAPSSYTPTHPYLSGNFAPVLDEYDNYECEIVEGRIPLDLEGGCYVRNGGNPVVAPEKGRHYHWFDGDGMLHGVFFSSVPSSPSSSSSSSPNTISPRYNNKHLDTPVLNLSIILSRSPLPSIALLVSPLSSLHKIAIAIIHTFLLAVQARVGTLSVANTSVVWWDTPDASASASSTPSSTPSSSGCSTPSNQRQPQARLLATCESGPPLEVRIPSLQTVGWDRLEDPHTGKSLREEYSAWNWKRFGLGRLQDDWITAHPRIDPHNGELIFYGCQMFDKPYVRYSVIDKSGKHLVWKKGVEVGMAKMMHDFACSRTRTIIMNLPLTLSPMNLLSLRPQPLLHFDRHLPSEFIIFPRHDPSPSATHRFVEPEPSMIFHTANTWDEVNNDGEDTVNMLSCRFKSAKLVYAAGAVGIPLSESIAGLNDVVQLHYHQFLFPTDSNDTHRISHSFSLSAIPFEFPNVRADKGMIKARYIYGCTMRNGSFDERLGAAKVDCLVKMDVLTLVEEGRIQGLTLGSSVDERSVAEILKEQETIENEGKTGKEGKKEEDLQQPISIFALPEGWYAQEPRFVPRVDGTSEDDGFILTYVYDEKHLLRNGKASLEAGTGSELWILDAKKLHIRSEAVVARIKLPQRVPYGLHGTYISATEISHQRPLPNTPLPQQLTLHQKIYRSSLRQVVDIIFTRPSHREKSQIEQLVTSIMFPLSWFFLLFGLFEAASKGFVGENRDIVGANNQTTGGGGGGGDRIPSHHLTGQFMTPAMDRAISFPWPQAATSVILIISMVMMNRNNNQAR